MEKTFSKKTLIMCNTYYQLIVAIQLSRTIKKDEDLTLILTDHSKNAKSVALELEKTNFFSKVYFVETWEMCQKKARVFHKLKDLFWGIVGYDLGINNIDIDYDEFICCNMDLAAHFIYSFLLKHNNSLKCNSFEEGILSYVNRMVFSDKICLIYGIRKMIGKRNLYYDNKLYYCFYPELYKERLKTVLIPKLEDDDNFRDSLADVFGVKLDKELYKEKYIYFSSVYDFEGGQPINEFMQVEKIAALIGKDNLLIKVHPRDKRNVYNKAGFNVDVNSNIPWEVIQLCFDFSQKVFITVNSGSVLSVSLMSTNGSKTFFIYKLCDYRNNSHAMITFKAIEQLFEKKEFITGLRNMKIVEKIEEILN